MRRRRADPVSSSSMTCRPGRRPQIASTADRCRHQCGVVQRRRTLRRLSKRCAGRPLGNLSLRSLHRAGRVPHRQCAGASYNPVISPDGHFIIFASDAQLTSGDTNAVTDTYVVDVTNPANPVYTLVSKLADGTQGNADSNRWRDHQRRRPVHRVRQRRFQFFVGRHPRHRRYLSSSIRPRAAARSSRKAPMRPRSSPQAVSSC